MPFLCSSPQAEQTQNSKLFRLAFRATPRHGLRLLSASSPHVIPQASQPDPDLELFPPGMALFDLQHLPAEARGLLQNSSILQAPSPVRNLSLRTAHERCIIGFVMGGGGRPGERTWDTLKLLPFQNLSPFSRSSPIQTFRRSRTQSHASP